MSKGKQLFINLFQRPYSGKVLELGILEHQENPVDSDISQSAYENLDIVISYLVKQGGYKSDYSDQKI